MTSKRKLIQETILLFLIVVITVSLLPVAGMAETTDVVCTAYDVTVTSDSHIGSSYTIDGKSGVSGAVVSKDGTAVIKVTAIPAGYELKVTHTGTGVFTCEGTTLTITGIKSNIQVTLSAEEPYIPPTPSGGGSSQPGGSVWQPAIPQGPVSADITLQYSSIQFIAVSVADIASVRTIDSQYAAGLENKLLTAEKAGIRLTNNKGARAIVQSNTDLPDINKVTFTRVYEISPANPDEKLTEVTVTVPKTAVALSGLTTDDVTIYHYLAQYDIWVPLDTLQITEDFINYYYTAATDGASPFGVLIMKFETETEVPTIPVEPAATPAPFIGLLAGLGAAAVFFGLRRR